MTVITRIIDKIIHAVTGETVGVPIVDEVIDPMGI